MSRIGKQPISLPEGVQVQIEPEIVRVNGPRGELSERKSRDIVVEQQNGDIVITRPTDRKEHRALHGLTRSLIANMIEGVTAGFEKRDFGLVPLRLELWAGFMFLNFDRDAAPLSDWLGDLPELLDEGSGRAASSCAASMRREEASRRRLRTSFRTLPLMTAR